MILTEDDDWWLIGRWRLWEVWVHHGVLVQ